MKLITTLALIFLITLVTAQEEIVGKWNTGKDNTQVEIKAIGNQHEGSIISSDNPNAPIGELIVKEVSKVGDNFEGKLYAIKRKRWVDAQFERDGEIIVVTISAGWKKKTIEWSKIN